MTVPRRTETLMQRTSSMSLEDARYGTHRAQSEDANHNRAEAYSGRQPYSADEEDSHDVEDSLIVDADEGLAAHQYPPLQLDMLARDDPESSLHTVRPGHGTTRSAGTAVEGIRTATSPEGVSKRSSSSQGNSDSGHDQARDSALRQALAASEVQLENGQQPSTGLKFPSFDDLLFDLLFAAVLTVYSSSLTLGNSGQVFGFVGFFALLWWTWWTQTVFDVRYRESPLRPVWLRFMQGVVRVALLGAWLAFASTVSEFSRQSFTNFAACYATTRACLGVDHLLVLGHNFSHHSRKFKVAVIVQVAAMTASGLLWVLSRYYDALPPVGWQQLVMWLCGIAAEAICQVAFEWHETFSPPFTETILADRLSTFGLIVLGEGFNGLGTVINSVSPGTRDWERNGIPVGGWGGSTILQVASSLMIVIAQFYSYFRGAVREIEAGAMTVLAWGYCHLILHLASAVTVVGLKNIILFFNTLSALMRYSDNPQNYLPDTPPWSNITASSWSDDDDVFDTLPPNVASTIGATVSLIQATNGAEIPTIQQADAMLNVSALVKPIKWNTPLRLQLSSMFDVVDAITDPDSFDAYIKKQLFHFKFLVAACAIFLAGDVVVKLIQFSQNREWRKWVWCLALRFFFAIVLVGVQMVYISSDGVPSDAALTGGLAIVASILVVEYLLRSVMVLRITRRRDRVSAYEHEGLKLRRLRHSA